MSKDTTQGYLHAVQQKRGFSTGVERNSVNIHKYIYSLEIAYSSETSIEKSSRDCNETTPLGANAAKLNLNISRKVSYMLEKVVNLNLNHVGDNDVNLCISEESRILPNIGSDAHNSIVNTNSMIFSLLEWQEGICNFDRNRYSVISKKKHFSCVSRFLSEVKKLDPSIAQRIVIYSGSALVLYGITYTRDIDIIIFGLSFDEIDNHIYSKLSASTRRYLDICVFTCSGSFVEYSPPSYLFPRSATPKIHHNNAILKSLLYSDLPEFSLYNQEMLSFLGIKRTNNILRNCILINGVHLFTFSLLKQFYISRFNFTDEGQRHMVILDMHLMIKYGNASRFRVKSWPTPKEFLDFESNYTYFENEKLEMDVVKLTLERILHVESH